MREVGRGPHLLRPIVSLRFLDAKVEFFYLFIFFSCRGSAAQVAPRGYYGERWRTEVGESRRERKG